MSSHLFFCFFCLCWRLLGAGLGAAYGTAKSGVGIASMGILKPELVIRNVIPVVMAGVLGIYGLIVGAILIGKGASTSASLRYAVHVPLRFVSVHGRPCVP